MPAKPLQFVMVAARVAGGEEVRRAHGCRVGDEVHYLDDARRREIDRDLRRADEEGEDEDIGEGGEVLGRIENRERCRSAHPFAWPVGPRAGFDDAVEP
jgi:hypothetical protein